MKWIDEMEKWAKGDKVQGLAMVIGGLALAAYVYYSSLQGDEVHTGMKWPLIVGALVLLGYGSFLFLTRVKFYSETKSRSASNEKEEYSKILRKCQTDHRNYTMFKPMWLVFIAVAVCAHLYLKDPWQQGLGLGLGMLFSIVYIIDSFLLRRLLPFLKSLEAS